MMPDNRIWATPSLRAIFKQVREAALSRPLGDFNLDGSVNGADLAEMLNALTDIKRYQLKYGLSDAQLLALPTSIRITSLLRLLEDSITVTFKPSWICC